MSITVSKSGIIWCIVLLVGVLLFGLGFSVHLKQKNPVTLSELDADNIEKGMYVSGEIPYILISNGNFGPVTTVTSYVTYNTYNIPLKEEHYIRILVNRHKTKSQLGDFGAGPADPVPFEGIVVKAPRPLNMKWYENVDGLDVEQVIEDFEILQFERREISTLIKAGLAIIASCLIVRFSKLIPPLFIKNEPIVSPIKTRYTGSVDLEYEYERELEKLQFLQDRLYALKRDMFWAVPLFFVGLLIAIISPYWEIDIVGYLLLFIALFLICQHLMNQPNRLGSILRAFSQQKPLQVQIEECQDNLMSISNRLGKTKEENSYNMNDLIYADFDVDL
ncbi:MAG: hypothetical protein IJX63_15910 [Lachnospiraceae bacterium]|nr:hypothetical protein [Lachnospiraceae bacterium]